MQLEPGFLADIVVHPDDDTPRLIYADWLEDNGDPERADFIRVQIALARGAGDAATTFQQREAALLRRNEFRWAAPVRRLGVDWLCFRRGMIECVALPALSLLRGAEALGRLAPVREISFPDGWANLGALAQGEKLVANLQGLRFHQDRPVSVSPRLLRTLLERTEVRGLRFLDVPWLQLAHLHLRWPGLLPGLEELGLRHCQFESAALETLFAPPCRARLRVLDLRNARMGDTEVEYLCQCEQARNLRWLLLQGVPLSDPAFEQILASPALRGLERLGWSSPLANQDLEQRLRQRFGAPA